VLSCHVDVGYVDTVKVRPRDAADQAAARAFLARHNTLRVARLGELVHPLDHPAFVAETPVGAYGIPLRDEIELERQP
jgi:hypothetical protein